MVELHGMKDTIDRLTMAITQLDGRVQQLEATINKGRGAFMMFLTLLSVIGAIVGTGKVLGK